MKDAQKPDHISLNTVISRLKEGRYVIPDFQRDFEWKPWDINDLMRSIFRDYYIGSLLLWKGKNSNFDALACEPVYGFNGDRDDREHIVLDGQQRLTAMYYTFMAPKDPLPNRKNRFLYFIRADRFMEEADDEAFFYEWTRRGPKLLTNREEQYEQHIFPLSVIGEGDMQLFRWIQGYLDFWEKRLNDYGEAVDQEANGVVERNFENAKDFGELVLDSYQSYQIAYIELDRDLEVDKVCDIFTKVNSTGIQLDVFDLINAMLKPKGLQLKHMWRNTTERLKFVETDRMNVYVLQVMSILLQAYCSPKYLYYLIPGQEKQIRDDRGKRSKEILIQDSAAFEELWNNAVDALEGAIELLRDPREFGAISSGYLPYVSIIPVFAAIQAHVDELPTVQKLAAKRMIRQWYWASVFNNRYSSSVETNSARDFMDLKSWIQDASAEPSMIGEFKARFRGLELQNEIYKGTSVYNAIFNLLILKGARDWTTGAVPKHGDLDDHHIVPKSWGRDNLTGRAEDTILNRTALTEETNRNVIRDDLPNEYLPRMIEDYGDEEVRKILESHLISMKAQQILLRSPFEKADFEEFIAERQRTIKDAIQDLLITEKLDISPHLRGLDESIQQVELELRTRIEQALDGDVALIPPHVANKVDERLQRAHSKNTAMDPEHYEMLHGQLEFFDLRELYDTIANKSLWSRFEDLFSNKQTLERRFDQLAELRNGIRHSRYVDEVAQKEGEAAIVWFERLLGR